MTESTKTMQTLLLASQILGLLLLGDLHQSQADAHYNFVVKHAPYTRLCSTKSILTVNGKFPGPTLYARKGEKITVDVYNKGDQNITIHWHGIKLPRYPWSDGPEYITQCPIQPGKKFRQRIIVTSEEGTVWWHAHSDWSRSTVHGAIVIYPQNSSSHYPYAYPHADTPIILGEWWKSDINDVLDEMRRTGGDPNVSDAYTINGQPGDFYPCSKQDTFKLQVEKGKTYLLRLIGAVMQDILFFAIANHSLTVVGTDGSYGKPFNSTYVAISPGQTIDVLLTANQSPGNYYMAARVYSSASGVAYDNTTATAIVAYKTTSSPPPSPSLPDLPYFNDTNASVAFTSQFRSLGSPEHPVYVPMNVTTKLFITLSVNGFPCPGGAPNDTCQGPNVTRLAASMNNISFENPSIDVLQSYYRRINGVVGWHFPAKPPVKFDYTAEYMPLEFETPKRTREVFVLEYNSTVEIVLQGTNLMAGTDHPMHLHGHSFLVLGWGFGNFDKKKDPLRYNLFDPPLQNTIAVPKNGWVAIRFRTRNPGVWFMHCHIERHLSWGMNMAFIVKDGKGYDQKLLPPPPDMPPC